jgi:hypothetical protein
MVKSACDSAVGPNARAFGFAFSSAPFSCPRAFSVSARAVGTAQQWMMLMHFSASVVAINFDEVLSRLNLRFFYFISIYSYIFFLLIARTRKNREKYLTNFPTNKNVHLNG